MGADKSLPCVALLKGLNRLSPSSKEAPAFKVVILVVLLFRVEGGEEAEFDVDVDVWNVNATDESDRAVSDKNPMRENAKGLIVLLLLLSKARVVTIMLIQVISRVLLINYGWALLFSFVAKY